MKIVILAGGSGTRLWPWSRERTPKQVLPFFGGATLLAQTYRRFRAIVKPNDIFVVAGRGHERAVRAELSGMPPGNLLLEPVRRDSAGAIGLAAAAVHAAHPNEVLMSFHSDAHIADEKKFASYVRRFERIARRFPHDTILAGITPSYPETGYGYIQVGKKVVQLEGSAVHLVKRFIEKPPLPRAKQFVRTKGYLWNPGWFAWNVGHLMSLYKKHMRKNYAVLKKISEAPPGAFQKTVDREFEHLVRAPIEYAILEKTKRRLVVPARISWSDIGHWRSVAEMSDKDKAGNVVENPSVLIDSSNNFFVSTSGKCIASVGVRDTILIETDDVILLADKERAQDVKQLVEALGRNVRTKKYL